LILRINMLNPARAAGAQGISISPDCHRNATGNVPELFSLGQHPGERRLDDC
jgi:hypothetical protein